MERVSEGGGWRTDEIQTVGRQRSDQEGIFLLSIVSSFIQIQRIIFFHQQFLVR